MGGCGLNKSGDLLALLPQALRGRIVPSSRARLDLAPRSSPGAPRFPQLTTIAMVESRMERGDKIETEQRSYISSRMLSAAAFSDGARGHWGIENNLHWTLDVTFNEDQSRLRTGHG